ncbi:sulfatase [uncultured Draconibacterium sp.]|uniref:sulfatase n=1 Tax=uncultured Draconibacterium sp. TaxID=1573823 RepID=UPI0025D08078|nr:sulfatase [uncultured Draconibacterium sp.]
MRTTIKTLSLIMLLLVAAQSTFAQNEKPNILFIFIDDLGYKDLGCYGTTLTETPNIDKLASEGMRFTQAYAYPVCTPTRASLISGQNSVRTNVWEVIGEDAPGVVDKPYGLMLSPEKALSIPERIETYGDILQKQGYAVAHAGKWHAGRTPDEEGFVSLDSIGIKDPALVEYAKNNSEWKVGELTAKAIEFMRENKKGPFIMNLHHKAVHVPILAREDLRTKYRKKIHKTGIKNVNPDYAAMTEMVDEAVGVVLAELNKLGLEKNTVVIFYSDNGGLISDAIPNVSLATSNLPLRGQKGGLYEGGIRVPLIVRWPGKVEPGTSCAEKVMTMDLFSTFLELGGAKVSDNQACDGLSIVPLVTGQKQTLGRDALYWHFPSSQWTRSPQGAIIKGDYKLVEDMETGRVELFNLANDIGETINLTTVKPEIARDLLNDLHKWRNEMGAKMPIPNPDFDPTREHEIGKAIWGKAH